MRRIGILLPAAADAVFQAEALQTGALNTSRARIAFPDFCKMTKAGLLS
jgi:hypothetical protein